MEFSEFIQRIVTTGFAQKALHWDYIQGNLAKSGEEL